VATLEVVSIFCPKTTQRAVRMWRGAARMTRPYGSAKAGGVKDTPAVRGLCREPGSSGTLDRQAYVPEFSALDGAGHDFSQEDMLVLIDSTMSAPRFRNN
jgi:hypothetical protein